ncbi:hypothetical protein AAOGI_41100 [Agarivorans albus]
MDMEQELKKFSLDFLESKLNSSEFDLKVKDYLKAEALFRLKPLKIDWLSNNFFYMFAPKHKLIRKAIKALKLTAKSRFVESAPDNFSAIEFNTGFLLTSKGELVAVSYLTLESGEKYQVDMLVSA